MIELLEDVDGFTTYGFTGTDQLWEVPRGVSTVWLSLVGATATAGNLQVPRGFANAPLEVESGATLRIRVGGRPEIVGLTDSIPVGFRWRMSDEGGWNGGGDGGGGGVAPPTAAGGYARWLVGQGGGGATTVHVVPPGSDPNAVLGELVAVAPGEGGNGWLEYWLAGYDIRDDPDVGPTQDRAPTALLSQRDWIARAAVAFADEEVADDAAPEALSLSYGPVGGVVTPPVSTPRTRAAVMDLPEPWGAMSPLGGFFTSQEVTLGNAGESFQGGRGRILGGTWATPGGGGGYGGGASGAYIEAVGSDDDPFSPGFTIKAIQGARHGGLLLPMRRPAGWTAPTLIAPNSTLLVTDEGGVAAGVRYLPDYTDSAGGLDPFDLLDPDDDGESTSTMIGHGGAAVQWVQGGGWHVGRVGWGRANGW